MYKTKKGENLSRTVLVLEPNINNLIHGLQLEISNVPTNTEIHNVLKLAGKTEIIDEGKLKITGCGHKFCEKCFDKIDKCAICRRNIRK